VPNIFESLDVEFQTDYYKILNDGKSNQRRYEEGGMLVLVTETENSSKERGHKVNKKPVLYFSRGKY
jgi:hypothetical protein